ncbi:nitroreductase family protein [Streptomyces sp. NPDC052225]|uniref:Acg family FMN-binding oxidoreductase n=1 Tax=Streptomyces sp. NPDC052225 TaxID=3154949 RepID=UPI00343AE64A
MPNRPLAAETVRSLVADAAAAPSMHNAQPWSFRFLTRTATLELRADLARAMPRSDSRHRALHLGCGAALFNLRVAAVHAGRRPDVRVLPDPADPLLLAAVELADSAPGADTAGLWPLYPAIHQRHTSRWPFADTEVPDDVRATLVDAARAEGAELDFVLSWHAEGIVDLVHDAEGRDAADPERRQEVDRWTRIGDDAEAATEGVPEYAFGPRQRAGNAPVRDFAGRNKVADRGATTFELIPHLALLGTKEDGPGDWIGAGQAMQRVLLTATTKGLATSLTSQALEWQDLRTLTRDPLTAMGHVQMVLRLGYGPQGPATPRRPVGDILKIL